MYATPQTTIPDNAICVWMYMQYFFPSYLASHPSTCLLCLHSLEFNSCIKFIFLFSLSFCYLICPWGVPNHISMFPKHFIDWGGVWLHLAFLKRGLWESQEICRELRYLDIRMFVSRRTQTLPQREQWVGAYFATNTMSTIELCETKHCLASSWRQTNIIIAQNLGASFDAKVKLQKKARICI